MERRKNQLQLFFILAFLFEQIVMESDCMLYLAPSTIAQSGRGLFAGTSIRGNMTFSEDTSIVLHEAHSYMGGLRNYVQPIADSDHVAIHLGSINFLNSIPFGPVNKAWLFDDIEPHSMSLPYSDFYPRASYSRQTISAGQELFTDYGDDWFRARQLTPQASPAKKQLTTDSLAQLGVCISDVYVTTSTIPAAHLGLFAHRSFAANELITISPVLLLRMRHVAVTKQTSSFMNYVITEPNAPVGILPLGNAAMINHASAHQANVFFAWFDWSAKVRNAAQAAKSQEEHVQQAIGHDSTLESLLQEPIASIMSYPFAALDLGFYASREIAAGEELFFDYGPAWEDFFQQCVDPDSRKLLPEYECLHMRRVIELPSRGLFPAHWYFSEEEQAAAMAMRTAQQETVNSNNKDNSNSKNNDQKQQEEAKTETVSASNNNNNNNNNKNNNNENNNTQDKEKDKEGGLGGRVASMFNNIFRNNNNRK